MRFEQMTPAHVRRALKAYLLHAWPDSCGQRPTLSLTDLEGLDELDILFERFERVEGGGGGLKRYTLRLGNSRYPFMKFVVQEHIVNGEYFFSVDTHDNLDIRPGNPDYAEWENLKHFNRRLKAEIEAEWDRVGLPTNHRLRALMEEIALLEKEEQKRKTILLVDDERDLAQGLAALLRARGYVVELARDGLEAMQRLEHGSLPDLVLLDYEMPQLDGEEVLERLRQDPRTEHLPVLLATASKIDLSRLRRVSGFLRKPYPRHVLFEMILRLLQASDDRQREVRSEVPDGANDPAGERTREKCPPDPSPPESSSERHGRQGAKKR